MFVKYERSKSSVAISLPEALDAAAFAMYTLDAWNVASGGWKQ